MSRIRLKNEAIIIPYGCQSALRPLTSPHSSYTGEPEQTAFRFITAIGHGGLAKKPYAVTPAKPVPDSDPGAGVQKS